MDHVATTLAVSPSGYLITIGTDERLVKDLGFGGHAGTRGLASPSALTTAVGGAGLHRALGRSVCALFLPDGQHAAVGSQHRHDLLGGVCLTLEMWRVRRGVLEPSKIDGRYSVGGCGTECPAICRRSARVGRGKGLEAGPAIIEFIEKKPGQHPGLLRPQNPLFRHRYVTVHEFKLSVYLVRYHRGTSPWCTLKFSPGAAQPEIRAAMLQRQLHLRAALLYVEEFDPDCASHLDTCQ
eukprot:1363133-Rhodomonas_salina.2